MKTVASLLILLTMALLIVPCGHGLHSGDADAYHHTHEGHHHDDDVQNNDHHPEETAETCSPFCSCVCCHVWLLSSADVTAGFLLNPESERTGFLPDTWILKSSNSVFQPPRA